MTDTPREKTRGEGGTGRPQPEARGQEQPPWSNGRWTSSIPQVASEDVIAIGGGRHAHFRRDRRFAQVQVVFTAPVGVDPNPGRELTGQFKELGWTWRPDEPGKPWVHQLEQSTEHDLTARGDSRDALHEQFLIILQEYREKHGMPPTIGRESLVGSEEPPDADRHPFPSGSVAEQPARISEKQKLPSEEEEARAGSGPAGLALGMLDAFASVGAGRFDVTLTDASGGKVGFRGGQPLDRLRADMRTILRDAAEQRHNVIVRPRSTAAALLQLDDLSTDAAALLRPVSFLILRTSPGNHQAWVAVADADEDFARRLRKGTGADPTASGATRVSGSMNFKEKHAPDFPTVEAVHVCAGRVVTRTELEALGVVAPAEAVTPTTVRRSHRSGPGGWPSYRRCLESAPEAREGGRPDVSRADFTFCLLAIDWGWSVEEIADRLMQVSGKARDEGERYALRTAQAAARAVERRGVSRG